MRKCACALCAGEPKLPKLLSAAATAAVVESSCSLELATAGEDPPTTPGCGFRVFGGRMGGGVGFVPPARGRTLVEYELEMVEIAGIS